ncbi:NlpC/P60 family protein [Streptomyces sp. NEAU-W12]|uniref:C40 family peptidase n=1 Tax=Streptomyces sp. NEAU-W12 TaxID=2994668 RepID=UPI00224B24E3|nr:C40 family peptidase [Streptomyces sp. NEAU-W12]MCX2922505.1 NlpC/P60 family protein [Streptomyces sp. NEAU-W12]
MGSHRRLEPSPGPGRGTTVTVGLLSAAAAALGAVPATAAPHEDPRAAVDRLHEEAERATEAYNKADERADTLRGQVNAARDEIARQQERVNTMRESLGSLAGAQYRSGGLDPSLALLFSDDPEDYLERASVLDRLTARQAGELRELREAVRSLDQDRAEASRKLGELDRSRKAVAAHKKTVERKLAQARRLLDTLPDDGRAAHGRSTRSGRGGPPVPDGAAASGRAAAAVAAARSALGKPYVWGANGPSGFDCSGLMQWSYAQAGIALPRTSQAQRHAGTQVPLAQARPGDLVVYRPDGSHVGMYTGNGQVIHAPYPGAPVRYDPVGMMPVSSVTRV